MESSDEKRPVVIKRGPASAPYAKIILPEKRKNSKDRRKVNTFIENDRRSGIADRRNPENMCAADQFHRKPFYDR